jgi:hypothetical protein
VIFSKSSNWLSLKIFRFPKSESRQRLEKYVIYLEQDVIDSQEKRWGKIKRKYLGSRRN